MLGVGSCVLGYSDNDIDKVAKKVISSGPLTTLNPPEEIELAEILLDIHKWADQVKFARTGGEMMAVAIRLARAYTNKEKLMICLGLILRAIETFDAFYYLKIGKDGLLEKIMKNKKHIMALLCRK